MPLLLKLFTSFETRDDRFFCQISFACILCVLNSDCTNYLVKIKTTFVHILMHGMCMCSGKSYADIHYTKFHRDNFWAGRSGLPCWWNTRGKTWLVNIEWTGLTTRNLFPVCKDLWVLSEKELCKLPRCSLKFSKIWRSNSCLKE